MKKLLTVIITSILLLSYSGCGSKEAAVSGSGEDKSSSESVGASEEAGASASDDRVPEDIIAVAAANSYDFGVEFPSDFIWAGDSELQRYQDTVAALKLAEIKKLVAVSSPRDADITVKLSAEQVGEIVNTMKSAIPTTFSQPENPNTGGALSIYIETEAQTVLIGFNGNWVTCFIEGEPAYWVLSAEGCSEDFYNIWGIVEEELSRQ